MHDEVHEFSPAMEWKLRAWALPVALGLAMWFHSSGVGHYLQRTFLSMMVHELGHAITAWLSGYAAIPTVWKTMIPDGRSSWVTVVLLALAAFWLWRGWSYRRLGEDWQVWSRWLAPGALLLIAVYCCRFSLSEHKAREAITFFGDGGAMVLGTGLMLCFFAPPNSRLVRNKLRWGFLVIGTAAFVDSFATWRSARTDPGAIPYGQIEGVGSSDPTRLVDDFGWSQKLMINRYYDLGVTCLVVLALIWAWSTWAMRKQAQQVST